jgi:hypothetical protein
MREILHAGTGAWKLSQVRSLETDKVFASGARGLPRPSHGPPFRNSRQDPGGLGPFGIRLVEVASAADAVEWLRRHAAPDAEDCSAGAWRG